MVWTLRSDEEKNNEIYNDPELASRTDVELAGLFHMVSRSLAHTTPGSPG